MITKETLEMYTKDINHDLAKIDADYKDYENQKKEYDNKLQSDKIEEEYGQSRKVVEKIKSQEKSVINKYGVITEELGKKLNEFSDPKNLFDKQEDLENKLEIKKEEIEIVKVVLKEKDPSYARTQKRFEEKQKAKRQTNIPELIRIP